MQRTRLTEMDVADGLPPPQRWRAMLAIAIAVSLSVLVTSIANIALPTIATDMGTTPSASIWVVNAYQLAVTVTLLPFATGFFLCTLASLAVVLVVEKGRLFTPHPMVS